jgi:aldose 1-epimerase
MSTERALARYDTEVSRSSGEQYEIAYGAQRAVVVEVGGGVRSYAVGERDVVEGYGRDEMCTAGRGQILAPWPNRLADGRYEFEGRRHQLPLTEPDAHNAIHGLVQWQPWRAREREPNRVVVEHMLRPQPGYPFALELSIEYALSDAGLTVSMAATNVGDEACPYGVGAHPYVTLGSQVDGATLILPADTVLLADARGIPTGSRAVAKTGFDFRQPRTIAATRFDHCFTDLARDGDGRTRVSLRGPETGVTVWVDEAFGYLMLYTGDTRPDIARRALAVEPMTCPPNAFQTGTDVVVLEPGESLTGSWGITPE